MQGANLFRRFGKTMLNMIAVVASVAVVFTALPVTGPVSAASTTVPVNMIYYGWYDSATENSIIAAHPEFLVGNSAAGPWRGNSNISKLASAGIKYFEYIDGGYESTYSRPIPTDLQSNLKYVAAAASAGAYGIFLDEVSDGVYTSANYYYLQQIADKAHSLGLKVVFNTGMFVWADQLMNYCDFINSSETWSNAPLTASQSKWASRTWLLTYGVYDASTGAGLTIGAWNKGVRAHFSTTSFGTLASWFDTYISQIKPYAPSTTSTSSPSGPATGQTSVTFSSNPAGTEVWVDYSYKGTTPLTLTTSSGSHHIGFYRYGYHNNSALEGDLLLGDATMTVNGDLVGGLITSKAGTGTGNTAGTVVGTPTPSGGINEYSFYLKITSSTVSGVAAGQQIWVAASTASFPNLLTTGVTLTGYLDRPLGWWVLKATP